MSDKYFSYYRVSSKDQAETGVSLEAQQEANLRHAQQHGFEIVKEFKEVQSAAKSGRKQFDLMLKEVVSNKDLRGIIFHDVDRSARTLSDWSKLGELADRGYKIEFSKDNSDLNSRGNRLTADIKAVVASDFIRNLSEETKKGMYKRLEQGWCVTGHNRLGYTSKGHGEVELNSVAPLIAECFNVYATGEYNLHALAEAMYQKGLRSKSGKKITWNKISRILKCKFYIGLMVVKGKVYNGRHQSIVPVVTFNKVQELLKRRYPFTPKYQLYKFQLMFACGYCGSRLRAITAKHKYHYYLCRNDKCLMHRPLSEEKIEDQILAAMKTIKFTDNQTKQMLVKIEEMKQLKDLTIGERKKILDLQKNNLKAKITKWADLWMEGGVSQEVFNERNQEMQMDLKLIEDQLNANYVSVDEAINKKEELIKLLADPVRAYNKANNEGKKKLVVVMMNNIKIFRGKIEFDWREGFNQFL